MEILTFFGSYGLKFLVSYLTNRQEIRASERQYNTETGKLDAEAIKSTRQDVKVGGIFGITACVLAVLAFLAIVVWPKVAPYVVSDVSVYMAYSEHSRMLLWPGPEKMKFQEMEGMVITPLDTHLLCAIAGLFFGPSVRRFK